MRIGKLLTKLTVVFTFCFSAGLYGGGDAGENMRGIVIAKNGKAKAEIVIPAEASDYIKFAADELKHYLDKITGGDFKITSTPTAPVSIRLGQSAESDAAGLDPSTLKRDGFFISAHGREIYILGQDNPKGTVSNKFYLYYHEPKRATLLGVYEFLERLGVRWLAPGPDHEIVPSKADIRIPEGTEKIEPYFPDRSLPLYRPAWNNYPDKSDYGDIDEMCLWGLRLKGSSAYMVAGCHTEQYLNLSKLWLPEHPERFALIDGKRAAWYSCWTDPGVIDMWKQLADAYFSGGVPSDAGLTHLNVWPWVFTVFNPDEFMIDPMVHDTGTGGCCRCERCNAFREKYPCKDDTELLWKVIAEIAEYIGEKHPGKFITTLVYPPKWSFPKYVEIPGNVRIRICVLGPVNMPLPAVTEYDANFIRKWGGVLKNKPVLWTYQTNAAFAGVLPGIPETYPHLFAEFLKLVREDIDGMFLEQISPVHTRCNLDAYIAARLLWNPDRDVEKEIAEYFTLYYGPGAAPARELFKRFEDNWIKYWKLATPDLPGEALSEAVGLPSTPVKKRRELVWMQVYTAEETAKIESLVSAVEEATANDPVYSRRAGLLRKWILNAMKKERERFVGAG